MAENREAELKELAELEELERLEALENQEQPVQEAAPEEEIGAIEAAVAGVRAGVPSLLQAASETVPMAAVSAGLVMEDKISVEQAIDGISETFNKNKADINADLDKARQAHPVPFEAADIGSAVVSTLAAPAAKLAKLSAQTAIGAATGFARSDQPLSREGALDALTGGAFGLFGGAAIKGAGKLASKLKSAAGFTTGEAISGSGIKGTKAINRHLRNTKQSHAQFADDLLSFKGSDGKAIVSLGRNRADMLEEITPLTKDLGNRYSIALKEADKLADKIPSQALHSKLKTELVDDILASPEPDTRAMGQSLLAYLDDTFKTLPNKDGVREFLPDWTVSKTQKLASDMSASVSNVFKRDVSKRFDLSQSKAKVSGIIRGEVENAIATVSPELSAGFKTIKRQYGNALTTQKILSDAVSKDSAGPMGFLKNALSTKGLLIGGISNVSTGGSAGAALGVAAVINTTLSSGRLPAGMAQQMNRMSNFLARNPDHPIMTRLLTAAHSTNDVFRNAVSSAIGEIELTESPLARTVTDAKERQSAIIGVARYLSPKLGASVKAAFESGDDEQIGLMMDTLARDPGANKLVQQGKGWNGKLYSAEDIQQAEELVEADQEMSLAQKLQHKIRLKKEGTIPQAQPEQENFLIWRSNKDEEPKI